MKTPSRDGEATRYEQYCCWFMLRHVLTYHTLFHTRLMYAYVCKSAVFSRTLFGYLLDVSDRRHREKSGPTSSHPPPQKPGPALFD